MNEKGGWIHNGNKHPKETYSREGVVFNASLKARAPFTPIWLFGMIERTKTCLKNKWDRLRCVNDELLFRAVPTRHTPSSWILHSENMTTTKEWKI